jgi:hypothetical protein
MAVLLNNSNTSENSVGVVATSCRRSESLNLCGC